MSEHRVPRGVLMCPVHHQTDCSVLLNNCTRPQQQAKAWLEQQHYAIHDGLMDAVADGNMEVSHDPETGEPRFRMTENGTAWARELLREHGVDPDDPTAIAEWLRQVGGDPR